ncbi:MAG: sel1 repeat family protein [Nitrospira sp.]|nr:sel1 repeat family protein [Nitrospira sp.]MCP9461298.1 sel1 repeat family protein [Nitrospira sp.]MCP9475942.1 sel1 repeat family protein [Nitrospira sp.]
MAKQGYPGLVLVPPSDRQLVKRRLTRWAFLALSMVGGISALNVWLPSPDQSTDCLRNLDLSFSADSHEKCNRPEQPTDQHVAAATDPPRNTDLALNGPSQKIDRPESRKVVTPQPAADRMIAQQETKQNFPAGLSGSEPKVAVRPMAKQEEKPILGRQTDTASPRPTPVPTTVPTAVSSPVPTVHATRDHQLAEQGDAFAQYRLGRFYAQRDGQQTPESVNWYGKASTGLRRLAEAGNGEAMYVLGVMYAFGRGVKRDTEEARRWLIQAVEHRIAAARPVLAGLEKHRLAENIRTDHDG